MRTWLRTGASIAGGVCLAACAAEASIGADACPRGAKCEVDEVPLLTDRVEVHTTGPTLEPVWKISELQAEGEEIRTIADQTTLAASPDGGLWLFTYTQQQLEAVLLDANGKVVGARAVTPPPGFIIEPSIPLTNFGRAVSHPDGPVIHVTWGVACQNSRPGEDALGCSSPLPEVLVFGSGLDQEPARVLPFAAASVGRTIHGLQRSRDGRAIFVSDQRGELWKHDLEGDVLWRRELSLERFGELPGASEFSASVEIDGPALSPEGSIFFSVMRYERRGGDRGFPAGMLAFSDAGEPSLHLYPTTTLIGESPSYGPFNTLAFDPQGNGIAVHAQEDGDLLVLRLYDDHTQVYRLLREDYADLSMRDIAVDPAGTLYLAADGGGRDERLSLLCRFPQQGTPNCFSMAPGLYEIEAPSTNVVFGAALELRDGVASYELARFDFE